MSRNSNYEQPAKFHQPSDVPVAAKYPSLPNAPDDISSAESGDRHPRLANFGATTRAHRLPFARF